MLLYYKTSDNPKLSDILGVRFLALVKGRLKEPRNPFADSLCQEEAKRWELVQEYAVLPGKHGSNWFC